MSVLTGKELRIVGFLCNWCSYGGADTAGVARFTQPTDLRIIRVPCSGRVNPLFPLKALLSGADGVLVSGCHPRDCHYSEGNYYARRRLETLKEFLPIIGIDPRRFEYTWVSASEGQRWQAVVTAFTERVHKLGPAPKFEDAKPMYVMPNLDLPAPLRPLGCGVNPAAMTELKDQIKAALEAKEVEFVMGWQKGFDGLHATPLYMRKPEDVEKLIWGPLNVHSLATYLPLFKGKKVGIVVKGCDSRGVVELLQENLINREDVVVFGMGCNGTIDINRVLAKIGDVTEVESVTGSDVLLTAVNGGFVLEAVSEKGEAFLAGTKLADGSDKMDEAKAAREKAAASQQPAPDLSKAARRLEQRFTDVDFWAEQTAKCLSCGACTYMCPTCQCFNISDEGNTLEGRRLRSWDNCMSPLFTREASGHNPRTAQALRMRNRVSHKYWYAPDYSDGRFACTGCGRCIKQCPVSLDIREIVLNAIADDAEAK